MKVLYGRIDTIAQRAHPRGGSSARDDSAEEETRNDGGDESYESAETTPEVALVAPVAPVSTYEYDTGLALCNAWDEEQRKIPPPYISIESPRSFVGTGESCAPTRE